MPIALGMRGPAYTSPISASTIGETIAPAMPWPRRAPTRSSVVGAAPQAADATTNSAVPQENTRRLPQRSPSRVTVMRRALKVRPYPATTHSRPLSEAWRSCCIEGSATLTMKKSRTTRKIPPMRTARGPQPASVRGFGEFMSETFRSPVGGESRLISRWFRDARCARSSTTGWVAALAARPRAVLTLPLGESVGWRHGLGGSPAEHRRVLADDVPVREDAAALSRDRVAGAGPRRPVDRLPLLRRLAGHDRTGDPAVP